MPLVQLPNGTTLDFPEGMSEGAMRDAIFGNFPEYAQSRGPAPVGDPLTRVSDSTPNTGASTFTANPTPEAGGGRGFVNPPKVGENPESVQETADRLDRNLSGSVIAGVREMGQAAGIATLAPAKAIDFVASLITGKEQTGAQDFAGKNFIDPNIAAAQFWAPKEADQPNIVDKVVNGLARMAPTIAAAIGTGGAGAVDAGAMGLEAVRQSVLHGMRSMSVPAFSSGITRAADLIRQGASLKEAVTAGLTEGATTDLTGGLAMSTPGANIASRFAQGAAVGATTGDVSRQAQNLAAPNFQQERTPEGVAVSALTGGVLATGMGHALPARMDLRPKVDPTEILKAPTVDEAIKTADESLKTDSPVDDLLSIRPLTEAPKFNEPQGGQIEVPNEPGVIRHADGYERDYRLTPPEAQDRPTLEQELSALQQQKAPDVSQPSDLQPVVAGTDGVRVPESAPSMAAGVGTVGEAGRALEPVRVGDEPARQPVPLATGTDAVEPAKTWFGRRGDGYVTVGDATMALPSRQKVWPDLSWRVEQLPDGKFRLAGYEGDARAVDKVVQQESIQPERSNGNEVRPTAETGVGDSVLRTEPRQAVDRAIAQEKPVEAQAKTVADVAPEAAAQRSEFENLSKAQLAAGEAFKDATPAVHRGEAERLDKAAAEMVSAPQIKSQYESLAESHRLAADQKESAINAQRAERILDAAGIKGAERLTALKDIKSGAITVDELARAHPAERGTTEPVTIPKDVVGNNEGGRSADDNTSGDPYEERQRMAARYYELRESDPKAAHEALTRMGEIDRQMRERDAASEAEAKAANPQAETYRGEHEAPMRDSGAPLHDLKGTYPDDFYGPRGQEFYGVGDGSDARAMSIVRALKGRKNASVTVYRAVPKDVTAKISRGDWVTIDKQYAKDHGDGALNGKYKIIQKTVRAKELFTNGDSIQEWGYDPTDSKPNESPAPNSDGAHPYEDGGTLKLHSGLSPEESIKAAGRVAEAINKGEYTGPGAKMIEGVKGFADGIVRDTFMNVAPMSTGSQEARATAQKFANDTRAARLQWVRMSELIKAKFSKEERQAMWDAADEQNTLMVEGKDTTGKGLDRLDERQRAHMELLHKYATELWGRGVEAGLVSGEGLPFWTPRMAAMIGEDGSFSKLTEPGKKATSSGEGRNIFTSAPSAKHRKYTGTTESEAALKAKMGENASYVHDILTMPLAMSRFEQAIAGRELINTIREIGVATGKATVDSAGGPDFFTLDHPAFTSYKPRMVEAGGKMTPAKDQNGEMIFDKTPIFISKEFEGPLKSVMSVRDGDIYSGFMLLKSKAMTAIMASPLTHNMVIYGRALAYSPMKVGTGYLYWKGHALAKDNQVMDKFVRAGLVPIGANKNSMMDITDVARGIGKEGSWGDPDQSWVSLSLKSLGNALHEGTGDKIKEKADALGDFVHHTLLWKQVGALQIGIAVDARNYLMAKGLSDASATALASHWANRYAGAVANENMSEMARKVANVMLFSRSFNMGNVGTIKDMFSGMPEGLKAKLMQDVGEIEGKKALDYATRKARATVLTDVGIAVLLNSVVQSAVDYWKKDKSLDEIEQGYMDRLSAMFSNAKEHPLEPSSYDPYRISPTYENEPDKHDRIDLGEQPGGRHEYMRLPTGKVVEDMIGWTMHFGETFEKKMSPMAKSVWQDIVNDKGFGIPVMDPEGSFFKHVFDVSSHVVEAQLPWDSLKNAYDLAKGKATDLDKAKLIGFATGFSASQGHPQGPEGAVASKTEERVQASKKYLMEQVRRDLKYGDEDAARAKLEAIGMNAKEIGIIIRNVEEPKSGLSRSARLRFLQHATEQEQKLMDSQR